MFKGLRRTNGPQCPWPSKRPCAAKACRGSQSEAECKVLLGCGTPRSGWGVGGGSVVPDRCKAQIRPPPVVQRW